MKRFIVMFVLATLVYYLGYDAIKELRCKTGNDGDIVLILTEKTLTEKEHIFVYEFINNVWVLIAVDPPSKLERQSSHGLLYRLQR